MVETEHSQNCDANSNNKSSVSWSTIDDISDESECKTIRVVKKIINPAVYVETPIYDMAPFKPRSRCLLIGDDEIPYRSMRVVKKCVCLTDRENCPCHPFEAKDEQSSIKQRFCSVSTVDTKVSLRSESETFFQKTSEDINNDFNILTQRSNLSFANQQRENNENERNFQIWLSRKLKERKEKEQEKLKTQEQQEMEKQKRIELERENFKRWLVHKKKVEEEKKKYIEQKLEQEKLKLEMKEKRSVENQLKYQLWLRRKEEKDLCKKIEEQMNVLKIEEEKQKRLDENQKAYKTWLKRSRNKPKPLPLNRGMETLRASASVTYINPTPWVPNIEKPNSQ